MTEPVPDPKPSAEANPPPEPLAYATPTRPDTPGFITVKGRWAIGCFGYILLSISWFFATPFLSTIGYVRWISAREMFSGWLLMTAVLLAVTLFLRLRYGFKGYGYGILSALGAGALIILGLFLLLLAFCATGQGSGHSNW